MVGTLTARFDATGRALAEAVAAIEAIVAALRNVASVFDSGAAASAVDDLMAAAEGLRSIQSLADARAGNMAQIRDSGSTLRNCADQILRSIQVLDVYGMNVKITASGTPEFMEFADRMRDKLNAAGSEVRSLDQSLGLLDTSLGEMARNDAMLVAECTKVIPQVPDRLMANAAALKEHQARLARLALSINSQAQSIRDELGLALGAIQIGDRVCQRLEHVLFGCSLLDGAASQADGGSKESEVLQQCLSPLLDALVSAAIAELREDGQSLLASLERLRDRSLGLSSLQRTEQGDKGQGFLALLEAAITEAEGMIAQFGQADRQGAATLGQIMQTVDQVTAKMAAITELRLEVRNMAINIGLSCRNVGALGRPIMVVANEIRTYSDRLDAIITTIAEAEARLLETSSRMNEGRADGGASVDQLARFLAAIHECDDRTADAMLAVESSSDVVSRLLTQAIGDMKEICNEAGNSLAVSPPAAQADVDAQDCDANVAAFLQSQFDALAAKYTMNDERLVHNSLIPPFLTAIALGNATSDTNDPHADDDEDDGLF